MLIWICHCCEWLCWRLCKLQTCWFGFYHLSTVPSFLVLWGFPCDILCLVISATVCGSVFSAAIVFECMCLMVIWLAVFCVSLELLLLRQFTGEVISLVMYSYMHEMLFTTSIVSPKYGDGGCCGSLVLSLKFYQSTWSFPCFGAFLLHPILVMHIRPKCMRPLPLL